MQKVDIRDVKSKEDAKRLEELTPIVDLKKKPFLPFTTMKECLDEYNLIMEEKSGLSAIQRTQVKNIIHSEVRKGNIVLTLE